MVVYVLVSNNLTRIPERDISNFDALRKGKLPQSQLFLEMSKGLQKLPFLNTRLQEKYAWVERSRKLEITKFIFYKLVVYNVTQSFHFIHLRCDAVGVFKPVLSRICSKSWANIGFLGYRSCSPNSFRMKWLKVVPNSENCLAGLMYPLEPC